MSTNIVIQPSLLRQTLLDVNNNLSASQAAACALRSQILEYVNNTSDQLMGKAFDEHRRMMSDAHVASLLAQDHLLSNLIAANNIHIQAINSILEDARYSREESENLLEIYHEQLRVVNNEIRRIESPWFFWVWSDVTTLMHLHRIRNFLENNIARENARLERIAAYEASTSSIYDPVEDEATAIEQFLLQLQHMEANISVGTFVIPTFELATAWEASRQLAYNGELTEEKWLLVRDALRRPNEAISDVEVEALFTLFATLERPEEIERFLRYMAHEVAGFNGGEHYNIDSWHVMSYFGIDNRMHRGNWFTVWSYCTDLMNRFMSLAGETLDALRDIELAVLLMNPDQFYTDLGEEGREQLTELAREIFPGVRDIQPYHLRQVYLESIFDARSQLMQRNSLLSQLNRITVDYADYGIDGRRGILGSWGADGPNLSLMTDDRNDQHFRLSFNSVYHIVDNVSNLQTGDPERWTTFGIGQAHNIRITTGLTPNSGTGHVNAGIARFHEDEFAWPGTLAVIWGHTQTEAANAVSGRIIGSIPKVGDLIGVGVAVAVNTRQDYLESNRLTRISDSIHENADLANLASHLGLMSVYVEHGPGNITMYLYDSGRAHVQLRALNTILEERGVGITDLELRGAPPITMDHVIDNSSVVYQLFRPDSDFELSQVIISSMPSIVDDFIRGNRRWVKE